MTAAAESGKSKTTKSDAKKDTGGEEKKAGGTLQAGRDILFLTVLVGAILWNTAYFPAMANWAAPAAIFFLEVIGLAVVGRMFGVSEPGKLLDVFSRK